jgi:hypothetical protein
MPRQKPQEPAGGDRTAKVTQGGFPGVVCHSEPLHSWFGLSYACYLVLPRVDPTRCGAGTTMGGSRPTRSVTDTATAIPTRSTSTACGETVPRKASAVRTSTKPVNSPAITPELVPQPHGGALAAPFPKGVSGNPGGRALSMQRLAREATDDGALLVAFHIAVLKGDTHTLLADWNIDKIPNVTERQASARELGDRAFGKAREAKDGEGQGLTQDVMWLRMLEKASNEERDVLLKLVGAALAGTIDVTPEGE